MLVDVDEVARVVLNDMLEDDVGDEMNGVIMLVLRRVKVTKLRVIDAHVTGGGNPRKLSFLVGANTRTVNPSVAPCPILPNCNCPGLFYPSDLSRFVHQRH